MKRRAAAAIGLLAVAIAAVVVIVARQARVPVQVQAPAPAPAPVPVPVPVPVPAPAPALAETELPSLLIPVEGVAAADLRDTFDDGRTGHRHEAIDIAAPRGTPVVAALDGRVEKLFTSVPGGLTVYQFDSARTYAYYYAHLDRYAEGLREGQALRRGELIGYVGSTGNAVSTAPHLHFAAFRLGPEKQWWKGEPIDPFRALGGGAGLRRGAVRPGP